jgi:6-pyruvoyltetrahydropterin/6-carboxytetrahydropterin synthase
MAIEMFRVLLEKESLTFSAAHFITFDGNVCERLHGHNYAVRCEVHGSLDENGYVVDFIALRDALANVSAYLDHHVLLPTQHPTIHVSTNGSEVLATFGDKRWIFPKDDCRLLPISNTTAELIAQYICSQLLERANDWNNHGLKKIVVSIDENQGQWGVCELEL